MRDLSIQEKIIPVYIEEEMKASYLAYSMSVIVGRALPGRNNSAGDFAILLT